MKTTTIMVGPELAKEWLESNTRNRTVSHMKVSMYAAHMRAGEWTEHHQGIAFYEDGALADGQHRLMAVAEAGVTVPMLVTFGITKEAAMGIDTHRARRTQDVLRIAEIGDWIGSEESAVIKQCMAYTGKLHMSSSPSAIADFGEAYKPHIAFAGALTGTKVRYVTVSSVRTAIACAHPFEDATRLKSFFRVLTTGLPESSEDHTAIRFRERLIKAAGVFQSGGEGRKRCVRLAMRAIKGFCEREPVSKFQEPDYFIYPILGSQE